MARGAVLTRDQYEAFNDLEEHEREELARRPNYSYGTRMMQIENRGFIIERGINFAGLDETTIPATIAQRNWGTFTNTRAPFHEDLVREFYASMVPEIFNDRGLVWVRGVPVEITSHAINEYLGTHINQAGAYEDGYPVSARFHPQLQRIAAGLRRSESELWEPGTTELMHGELKPDLAFWSVFLSHSLVPSTHRTVLTVDTARILYAILTDVHFDVGYFIFNSILRTGCDTRCLLTFPCLITHFCGIAGVRDAFNTNALQPPPADVDKKAYNSFCTRHGLPNVAPGRRNRRRGAAAQPQAPPQTHEPQPPQGGHQANIPPWGEELIHTVAEVRDNLGRLYDVVERRYTTVTYQRRNRRDAAGPSSSRQPREEDSD